jgi:hypothetical protein
MGEICIRGLLRRFSLTANGTPDRAVGTKFASEFSTGVAAEIREKPCCIVERSCVETRHTATPENPITGSIPMAARKKTARKSAAKKKTTRKKKRPNVRARIEAELPKSLTEFVRQVNTRLNRLEKQLEKAEGRYRREWTRTLKNVSRQLGRFEAEGEKRWNKLTAGPRRDAVRLLRKLEKAIEPSKARPASRKKAPRRKKAARSKKSA